MVRSDEMNGFEKTYRSRARERDSQCINQVTITYWVRDEEIRVELISQQVLAIKKIQRAGTEIILISSRILCVGSRIIHELRGVGHKNAELIYDTGVWLGKVRTR